MRCNQGIVVAANYNCPGQLVISGEIDAINKACESLKEKGAKMTVVITCWWCISLTINGACR